ncbi:MAG: 2-C-methyl-D-erythritol 4-phosphate cytidylyltransferase [Chlamydiae bacterium]|nr:2-C-methyl-D-erythritol 4-phosphate cytidylyltransferase [Chlamydiota bacterium]MBI3276803.1 2-C-methyl-D-erythritol 4-phosphate cytidylyltransferase [Chlamydiota bacterium]
MKISAIIVAAGKGERFGGNIPKAFFPLNRKPLLAYVLEAFNQVSDIVEIIVTLRSSLMGEFWEKQMGKFSLVKPIKLVQGGETRSDSVWNALQKVDRESEIVLIHDAARPFVTLQLISDVIEGALKWGASIPGLRVKPTIKEVNPKGFIVKTHDREKLFEAQTPQGFRVDLLKEAFKKASSTRSIATDEAFLIESQGGRVKVVEGDEKNIKITTPADLEWAEWIMHRSSS